MTREIVDHIRLRFAQGGGISADEILGIFEYIDKLEAFRDTARMIVADFDKSMAKVKND